MRASRPTGGSNFASAPIWATWSKRPTGTLWATASISPRGWKAFAQPARSAMSEDFYRQLKGRLDLAVTDLGPKQLKNIADPIRVYSLDVGQPAQAKSAPIRVAGKIRSAASLDRCFAVRQYRRRPGTGAFRRRGHGEPHDRSLAYPERRRDRPQHGFHLQGQAVRREDHRPRLERSLRPRGQRSARRGTACASTCSSSTPRPAVISGRSASTSRLPISSTCKTRSLRVWRMR